MRPTTSPTRPRATPSGLTRMRVRSVAMVGSPGGVGGGSLPDGGARRQPRRTAASLRPGKEVDVLVVVVAVRRMHHLVVEAVVEREEAGPRRADEVERTGDHDTVARPRYGQGQVERCVDLVGHLDHDPGPGPD